MNHKTKIPPNWSWTPLNEASWFQEGPGLRNWQFTDKGIKVVNITNMVNGKLDLSKTDRHISEKEAQIQYSHFLIDETDILVASSGNSYSKVALVVKANLPLLMNTSVIRFKPKSATREFLLQYLKSPYFKNEIDFLITGSAQPNFGPFHLNKLLIALPPLSQQNKIAKILSVTDSILEKTVAAIEKYISIKKGMTHDLFTRGIDIATGKLRPNYTDAPELYKESELGMIPKEWDVDTISKVSINLDGKRIPIKQENRAEIKGIYPYYGASGIIDFVDDFIFDEPLILLGEDGENVISRNLPLAFIVDGKFWVNNHAHVLKPNEDMNINFLCELLESLDYSSIVSGSAQPKITQSHLNKIKLIKPSLLEQNEISKRLTSITRKIEAEDKYLSKIRAIKAGLVQDLLSGLVEVKVNEEELA